MMRLARVLGEISSRLAAIDTKLGVIMSEQSQLDADVAKLGGVLSDIQTAEQANTAAVQAASDEIAKLIAAQGSGQPLDLTGLEAIINGSADGTTPGMVQAAESVTAGVAAVQGLVPATDAPPAS
jgi:hypothetical protein